MADDLNEKGAADRTRVNVNEEHEVRYWAKRFDIDADELRGIVEKVGPMVQDVEAEVDARK